MTYLQATILGFMQGISELFPVSSLGHSMILPKLCHWSLDQHNPFFLTFLVATHFATALVLLLFFWTDWKKIVGGLARSVAARKIDQHDTAAKLGWLLLVGTIPGRPARPGIGKTAAKLVCQPAICRHLPDL